MSSAVAVSSNRRASKSKDVIPQYRTSSHRFRGQGTRLLTQGGVARRAASRNVATRITASDDQGGRIGRPSKRRTVTAAATSGASEQAGDRVARSTTSGSAGRPDDTRREQKRTSAGPRRPAGAVLADLLRVDVAVVGVDAEPRLGGVRAALGVRS